MVNSWRLVSLQKPLHQRLYLTFKPLNFVPRFIFTVNLHTFPQYTAPISSIDQTIFNSATSITTISYSKLLSRLCQSKALLPGLQIHTHLTKLALDKDPKHRNHLINLYAKCRLFEYALKLIEENPEPDLVSWSSLISGYVQNGNIGDALLAFHQMHKLGIKCNEFTFPSVLKACSISREFSLGRQVHGAVLVNGFGGDVYVANALVGMYAKCGEFKDATRLFEEIPERNVVSWNAMFACYTQKDLFPEAISLFSEMVNSGIRPDEFSLSNILNASTGLGDIRQGKIIHGFLVKLGYDYDPYSCNALVDMYAKVGDFEDAVTAFEDIPEPDIVSWNAAIAGCVLHENHDCAFDLLQKMRRSGLSPNMFTLSSTLKACAGLGLPELDLECLTLFMDMYKEGIGYDQTTLLAVLNSSAGLHAINICAQVHALAIKSGFQSDTFVINSLVDSYGKCNQLEDAGKIFKECPLPDLPSFTSIITAYAQYGQGEEALKFYLKMRDMNLKPDSFVCSSLLNACANLSAFEQGKQIHVHVMKLGFMSDVFAGNSLVNMYAKCGSIEDASNVFSEVTERGVVSYSAMIGGLAQHGHGKEALHLFNEMLKEGVYPNHITLVSVLYACNHAGLVTEAQRHFATMKDSFGIEPTQEHYACMIDVLGRAGKLDEAVDLVNKMPFEANGSVWGALLGAARIHKNVELGKRAAKMLFTLEPEKSGTHVLLANIYASAGLWENVARVRKQMKFSKVKKEPGMSWFELKDKVYTFIVGDRSHPRSEEIYAKLEELGDQMAKAGYVPMVEVDLHNVEHREKELLLSYHSEKLAVAFALILTPPGSPIRVKKNLRICLDCHTAFKFICKIVSREIIIRDTNRFHHFKNGACSCGDYW